MFCMFLCAVLWRNEWIIIINFRQGRNLKQKWSRIRIWISGLIRIWISAGSLSKCSGFILLHVNVSHFAKYSNNWPVTMKNANRSPKIRYSEWWGKWKSDPESVSRTGSPPNVKQFFRLVGLCSMQSQHKVSVKSAHYFFSNPAHRQNDSQTAPITQRHWRR